MSSRAAVGAEGHVVSLDRRGVCGLAGGSSSSSPSEFQDVAFRLGGLVALRGQPSAVQVGPTSMSGSSSAMIDRCMQHAQCKTRRRLCQLAIHRGLARVDLTHHAHLAPQKRRRAGALRDSRRGLKGDGHELGRLRRWWIAPDLRLTASCNPGTPAGTAGPRAGVVLRRPPSVRREAVVTSCRGSWIRARRVAKKHGQGSPVAENGDRRGTRCGDQTSGRARRHRRDGLHISIGLLDGVARPGHRATSWP